MTTVIQSLRDIGQSYDALFCDLWGCLHDGTKALPEAVAALQDYRAAGKTVVLLTNSPRPRASVAAQLEQLGAPDSCYDLIISSGDAAQMAMAAGQFGRRVYHIGPERDLAFFSDGDGNPYDIERVSLEEAEGIVCTGLFDDRSETAEDYRATVLYGKTKGLKLLCANPDIVVDVGDLRIYCAGAIAEAYANAGGKSYYFGKPHPPIYALARDRLAELTGLPAQSADILCIGDGIGTDIAGAMGEELDSVFVTGGLAATETGTSKDGGPDEQLLADFLSEAKMAPRYAMPFLR